MKEKNPKWLKSVKKFVSILGNCQKKKKNASNVRKNLKVSEIFKGNILKSTISNDFQKIENVGKIERKKFRLLKITLKKIQDVKNVLKEKNSDCLNSY